MPIVYREIISLARDDVTRRKILEIERKYLSEFNGDYLTVIILLFLENFRQRLGNFIEN